MTRIELVDRDKFVFVRYENWKRKVAMIAEMRMEKIANLTNLDKTFEGFDKPMKEVILCDWCNEDILEPQFVMFEGLKVYHRACFESFSAPLETAKVIRIDNFRVGIKK